jgi:hypothetical protein
VRYVVIGGAAAEARGWRGRSLDIDVVPAPDESNLDRLAVALNELDARLAVGRASATRKASRRFPCFARASSRRGR